MNDNAQPSGQGPSDTIKWGWPLWVGIALLVALVVRVLNAASWQFSFDSDASTVQVMAKHIAEGLDFPVFFYGQPYMGSLEPAISALLCRLFGTTSFVVTLGTALLGVLSLPLIYLWGRSAGGKRVGLLAMAYCIVGSRSFLFHSVMPRGGYMTMLVCGLLTVWLATRIVASRSGGRPASLFQYLAMGLAAGLGWWSNQLVVPFLAAAGVVLIPTLRKGNGWPGVFSALGGFLVGCLPWWAWNLTHGWQSISYFTTSTKGFPFRTGLYCAWRAFCGMFEVQPESWQNVLQLVLLFGMMAGFVILWIRDLARRENQHQAAGRWALVLVFVVNIVLYARSDYGCPPESRYLMPLFPAVAVMLGITADWVLRRFRFPYGLLLFALVVPKHVYVLPMMFDHTGPERILWQAVERDAPKIAALCNGVCVGDWDHNWINFASREVLTVPSLPKDRYVPRTIRGEVAARPAFFAGFGRVETFVRDTAGTYQQTNLASRITVTYALTPPPSDWDYVNSSNIVEMRDNQGADFRAVLTDWNVGTCWSSSVKPGEPVTLTCTFDTPENLCGIRYLTPDDLGPHRLRIEAQLSAEGEWITLMPTTHPTFFFWSGPYPAVNGIQFFPEFRFNTPSGGVRRLRLTMDPAETTYRQRIGEILLLRKAPGQDATLPTIEDCENAVRRHGVKKFYGPRWLVSRIAARKDDVATITRAPSIFQRSINDTTEYDSRDPLPILLGETTGFLMDHRDVPRSRAVLESLHLEWEETPLGSYTLLVVRRPNPESDAANYPTLCWTELGCFANDLTPFRKVRAQRLYEKAIQSETDKVDALAQALQFYPDHQPAREALVSALEKAGRHDEAVSNADVLKTLTVPELPARARFDNGVELLGLSLPSRDVEIGGIFTVVYFWKCPPTAKIRDLNVFVHFRKEETEFQDDHPLLEEVPKRELEYQPFDEVFTERREIAIPSTLSPGDYTYTIRMGLFDRRGHLRPTTDLKTESRGILLPVSLTVKPLQETHETP